MYVECNCGIVSCAFSSKTLQKRTCHKSHMEEKLQDDLPQCDLLFGGNVPSFHTLCKYL